MKYTEKFCTIGGEVWTLATSCRYLLILREGSMSSCRSENNLQYLVGNFSHVCRNRFTDVCPKPDMTANNELKFLHSLQCPVKNPNKLIQKSSLARMKLRINKNTVNLRANFMNCFIILDLLTRFDSEQISVTTQNISLLTNCNHEMKHSIRN